MSWRILPIGASVPDNPDKPEIIEQGISKTYKSSDGDPEDDISNSSDGRCTACCCCGCDTGLFDMLNNAQCEDGAECDCSKDVEI